MRRCQRFTCYYYFLPVVARQTLIHGKPSAWKMRGVMELRMRAGDSLIAPEIIDINNPEHAGE